MKNKNPVYAETVLKMTFTNNLQVLRASLLYFRYFNLIYTLKIYTAKQMSVQQETISISSIKNNLRIL